MVKYMYVIAKGHAWSTKPFMQQRCTHSLTHPEKVQAAVGSDDFKVFSASGLEQPCAVSQHIYHSKLPFTSLHDLATDLFTYELYIHGSTRVGCSARDMCSFEHSTS